MLKITSLYAAFLINKEKNTIVCQMCTPNISGLRDTLLDWRKGHNPETHSIDWTLLMSEDED